MYIDIEYQYSRKNLSIFRTRNIDKFETVNDNQLYLSTWLSSHTTKQSNNWTLSQLAWSE